jgi:cephalosporin hydroxylase
MARDEQSATPPWDKDPRRIILTDGSYVVGQTVAEEAVKCGLGVGGYTMCAEPSINQRFRMIAVDRWDKAANLNAFASNAVLILAQDPRAQLIDMMVTRAKERHRPVRIIIDGEHIEDAVRWLDALNDKTTMKRLFIGGTGSNTVARRVCEQVLPAFSKMLMRPHES